MKATTIPYFNKMFCSGMIETSKEVIPICLGNLDTGIY